MATETGQKQFTRHLCLLTSAAAAAAAARTRITESLDESLDESLYQCILSLLFTHSIDLYASCTHLIAGERCEKNACKNMLPPFSPSSSSSCSFCYSQASSSASSSFSSCSSSHLHLPITWSGESLLDLSFATNFNEKDEQRWESEREDEQECNKRAREK